MDQRYMPSIFNECDELKKTYDRCFTEFFQKFLTPNSRQQYLTNPCERLHEVYKDCVLEGLSKRKLYDIDLDEVRREVLNTVADKLKKTQEEREQKEQQKDSHK